MILEHPEAIQATEELIHDIQQVVTHAAFDRMTRTLFSTDASIYQMMPVGVVYPQNAAEASAAIAVAAKHKVPILPRGGGSSLAGQAVGHALILDFSRFMDQVLAIDVEAKRVRTQPGITLGNMNKILAERGLMFGPDPASGDRATMGGIIGNNSTGAHSIIYGMTHDHVLGLEMVLSDASQARFEAQSSDWESLGRRAGLEGQLYQAISAILSQYGPEIERRYPQTFRHVAGYNLHLLQRAHKPDLTALITGSEGTLGVITEATLNLVPVPKAKRLALVHFSNLRQAMEAVPQILESQPDAIEVLDKMLLDLTRDRVEYRRLLTFVQGDPAIILVVEYTGESDSKLDADIQTLDAILKRNHHHDPVVVVADKVGQANVWYVRKLGLGILMSVRGDAKPIPFIEDATVPVAHLADYVTQIFDYAYSTGVQKVAMYAHASAGCLHIRPLINLKTGEGVRQLRAVAEKSLELVKQFHGTTSGEHGDGIARSEWLEPLFGPDIIQAFHKIKAAFDPENLLNPGKVVDPPRMDDERLMRYGSNYSLPQAPSETVFTFASDGGFTRAVEMCNGAGVCRKLGEGVMCPSFQATKDETHSTRGRANALRAAMMGRLGEQGFTSQEVYAVMDLCLACQGCLGECPSAVDMAKLKAEFLHNYYQEHGTPLRSRVFANIHTLNRWMQPIAPLSNLVLKGPGKLVSNALGVHPARELPALAPQTFSTWYKQQTPRLQPVAEKQVVFFHDTFMEHNHPEIGVAAIQVLEAAGYLPILLENKKCCGRPAVSKGLLDEAKALAEHNVAILAPYAQAGIPIVGCEPSCIAMLVKEYLDFVPGEDSQKIAEMAMCIDSFLVRERDAGNLDLQFDSTPRQVAFHGHCQQKANFGTADTVAMLGMIPNCTVNEIDSGCCGMAGSFGYEKEHYELSIQLAEMSLAPAVRQVNPGTIICATGTSCREQIEHTTEREGIHPIEVLAEALLLGG